MNYSLTKKQQLPLTYYRLLQALLVFIFVAIKPSFALPLTEINSESSVYDISNNIDKVRTIIDIKN